MAEYLQCPNCKQFVNLEIDIHRDEAGNLYCNYCNSIIQLKQKNKSGGNNNDMKINTIIELLEEIYTSAEIVEMLQDIDSYDIEKYALDHDICSRCYGELGRYEWYEDRGEFWGFPCKQRMVGARCVQCGEIYD